MTKRAVALRALGLGDLLTAVPALRAVRRGLPGYEVVLAAPRWLAPLVRLAGVADRFLAAEPLQPLEWKWKPPRVAVNLHGRGPESHRLLGALDPGRLVAFGSPEAGVDGPAWEAGEHEVLRWCRLAESAGWPADPTDLRIGVPLFPAGARGAVVIHPGAAHASRRWPAERFADVARWARGTRLPVVVTGSTAERELAGHVGRLAGLEDKTILAGRTQIEELAALVADASLVICGDTGMAHLASAYGTPSVVLFGPVPPSEWGPPPQGPHRVLWHGRERHEAGGRGDPLGPTPDSALLRITVAEVVAAGTALLSLPGASRSGSASRTAQQVTPEAADADEAAQCGSAEVASTAVRPPTPPERRTTPASA